MSLGKIWNVAIAKVFNIQFEKKTLHIVCIIWFTIEPCNSHAKSRFIKFMVANIVTIYNYVAYVANLCFRNDV